MNIIIVQCLVSNVLDKNIRFIFVFFALLLTLNFGLWTSDRLYAKDNSGLAAEYLLTFYPDAGSSARAGAATAVTGSAAASYYNPANVASLIYNEVSFFYTPLFYGTKFTYISYASPVTGQETIAGSIGVLSTGDIEKTNSIGETLYDFSSQESVFNFTYAGMVGAMTSAGVNVKFLSQNIDDFTARAFSADIGLVSDRSDIKFGIAAKNVIPFKLGGDKLPVSLRFGLMQQVYGDFFLCGDLAFDDMSVKVVPRWFLGSEYSYKTFFLRAGVNYKEVTCGVGMRDERFSLDYAVSLHTLDITHRFSVALRFGIEATKAQKQAARMLKENRENFEKVVQRIVDEKRKLSDDKKTFEYEKEKIEKLMLSDADLKSKWEDIQAEKEKLARDLQRTRKEKKLSEMLLDAQKYYEKKEFDKAVNIIKKILKENPNNKEAEILFRKITEGHESAAINDIYLKAVEFYEKGEFIKAAEKSEEVIQMDNNHSDAQVLFHQSKAQDYITKQKYQNAKYELIEAIKIKPDDKNILELLKRVQTTIDMME
ncbi:MAG: hypothetical protein JW983_05620 [Elusimicrobia bacterium]|nr:hypothetical protein [Elusimicrobiota bacterium]